MKISELKIDARAAVDGAWVRDIPGFGDFGVLTRSIDCPQADAYQQELYRVILGRRARRRDRDIPPEVRDYVQARALIDVCVIGWENWEDDAGAAVPYSKEALSNVLLVDAPKGIVSIDSKGRRRVYSPSDRKAFNLAMKQFYLGLVDAALRVDAPDDEDEAAAPPVETGELPEKNA